MTVSSEGRTGVTGVCFEAEDVADWIVAREQGDIIASHFQIFESMLLSTDHVLDLSLPEI